MCLEGAKVEVRVARPRLWLSVQRSCHALHVAAWDSEGLVLWGRALP